MKTSDPMLLRSVAAHVRALCKAPPAAYEGAAKGLAKLEEDFKRADAKR